MADWDNESFNAFNSGVTEGYGSEMLEEQVKTFIDILDISPKHKSLVSLKLLGKSMGQRLRGFMSEAKEVITFGENNTIYFPVVPYGKIDYPIMGAPNNSIADHPALLRQAGLTVVKN